MLKPSPTSTATTLSPIWLGRKICTPRGGRHHHLDIKAGRHPVIETLMPVGEEYIANDILLDTESQQIVIVTGPNMAGKSALLRQTALITLLAQMGSFVPADSARVGLVDKILPVWEHPDNISVGESTFMWNERSCQHHEQSQRSRSLVLF